MLNVFSLFILFLLSDGCIYYDGQRVRLKGLKKDELNGKYGIINNKNNNNKERCGVLIDGEKESNMAIKFENLVKIQTILIHGEQHDLVDPKELYDFITKNLQDRIGLESGNIIEEGRVYGLYTKNVFGFDDERAKLFIENGDDIELEMDDKLEWMKQMIASMLFSDDKMFRELERKSKMDLQEWRDMRKQFHYILEFRRKFGDNAENMNHHHKISEAEGILRYLKLKQDFFLKVKHLKDHDTPSIIKYLNGNAGLTKSKMSQLINIWLELIKDYLVDKMKSDKFVDQKKYNFIYKETLNGNFVNMFNKYHHPGSFYWLQMQHLTIIRDIMASQKIVEEYIKYYNEGSNVYIFIGDGHVKRLEFMIRKRLSLLIKEGLLNIKNEDEAHVGITEIFPHWIENHDVRDDSFDYYYLATEQDPDSFIIVS